MVHSLFALCHNLEFFFMCYQNATLICIALLYCKYSNAYQWCILIVLTALLFRAFNPWGASVCECSLCSRCIYGQNKGVVFVP